MVNQRKKIWVCLACGKRSNDKNGDNLIDKGWDVSCMMNSTEVFEDECVVENNRVKQIKTIKIKKAKQ